MERHELWESCPHLVPAFVFCSCPTAHSREYLHATLYLCPIADGPSSRSHSLCGCATPPAEQPKTAPPPAERSVQQAQSPKETPQAKEPQAEKSAAGAQNAKPAAKPEAAEPAPAPRDEIKADSIEGMSVSLQPAEKRVLLVLLMDTADPKSNELAKAAVVLYRRFHEHGLDAVSIYTDKSEDPIFTFAERWQVPWAQVMDKAEGKTDGQAGKNAKPLSATPSGQGPRAAGSFPAKGTPVDLKLTEETATHETVAKLLGVSLDNVPMPEKVVAKVIKDPEQAVNPLAGLITLAEETDIKKEPGKAAEQIVKLLAEDGGTQMGSIVVEWLAATTKGEIAAVVKATMEKLPPKDQVRFASGVMQRATDDIESVVPFLAKLDDGDPVIAKMSRWDRSLCGRALVLGGEYAKGRKILRTIAEQSDSKGNRLVVRGSAGPTCSTARPTPPRRLCSRPIARMESTTVRPPRCRATSPRSSWGKRMRIP